MAKSLSEAFDKVNKVRIRLKCNRLTETAANHIASETLKSAMREHLEEIGFKQVQISQVNALFTEACSIDIQAVDKMGELTHQRIQVKTLV